MYSELNKKIKNAREGIARLHKIDSMLNSMKIEEERLRSRERELKAVFDKESYDVEKLKNASIASVFYTILGSLEEHTEKERREALAAKLKYDQSVRDLEDVRLQISELISERGKYLDCQRQYDDLYACKKEELMRGNDSTAQRLLELNTEINEAGINLQEIQEAISAGENVLEGLERALSRLDSAEGWGTFDLFGGGLISDLAKHSCIDDAKMEVERTQGLLRLFQSELADIDISTEIMIETNGFAKFADFFFDGLIADWFMQSKINQSQDNVLSVRNKVQEVVEKLGYMQTMQKQKLEEIEAESSQLVING